VKTKWIDEKIKYDGTQLKHQFNYFHFGLLGNSAIAFRGACDVSFEEMLDGEDLLAQAKICGSDMLHVLVEVFDHSLFSGVAFQRLIADLGRGLLEDLNPDLRGQILREGDDLYFDGRKLSISIAAPTLRGFVIHWAINISTSGTPVPTASLSELKVDSTVYGKELLARISAEYGDLLSATFKVRPSL
jgi:hypothetical protein